MNILYVCSDRGIPVLGNKGASVHLRAITGAMQELGHRVTVVARRCDGNNPPPSVHRLERLPSDPDEAAELIEQLIRAERSDLAIERYSLQTGIARAVTRRCGVPLMLEVNAPLVQEATRYRGLNDPFAERREHETFRNADRIQVVSSALARYVRSVAPEVPVAWISNGADTRRFRDVRPSALPGMRGRIIVGIVASMKPWHGLEHLLDAFALVRPRYPDAAVVLVGSGPQESVVLERVSRRDLRDSVVWIGQVPHAQVPSLVASFDIAVAPYLQIDDFYFDPLKVVEYLAAGKPVIYSKQGDLPTLVGSGGLGYAPGSTEELAGRLAQLLGDPSLRRRLAASATAVGSRLDWSTVAERVLRFAAEGGDPQAMPMSAAEPVVRA